MSSRITGSVLFANVRHRPNRQLGLPFRLCQTTNEAGATRDASLIATRLWRRANKRCYGQVEDTIVTVSTLSFRAFALEDAEVADVALVDAELPDAGSTVPAMVTL